MYRKAVTYTSRKLNKLQTGPLQRDSLTYSKNAEKQREILEDCKTKMTQHQPL